MLAHRLSFSALGTYTILLSMVTYVAFVKASVMNAAVVGVARAAAQDDPARLDVVVSTGLLIYLAIGVISGVALCAIGLGVLPLLNIPRGLHHAAVLGVVGLSVATLLSWPLQIFDDLLRGLQRFAAVSGLEIFAMVVYVTGALIMAFSGAPVWALVTWNAAIPLLMGLACLFALRAVGVHVKVGPRLVTRAEAKRFGSFSGMLLVGGVADLAVYSIDRFVLSSIRSPATVGRYEGPLGAQNLIRYLNGVLSAPVVPIASAFLEAGDVARVRELFVKGARYTYAATVPFAIVMVVYGAPVLRLWLGNRFGSTGTAASIFCAWWLVGAGTGIVGTILIAAGRVKLIVATSWLAAAVNLTLMLSLTWSLGIYAPIVSTLVAFAAAFSFTLPAAMRTADVRWRTAFREACLPAYATGIPLAGALLVLRWLADFTTKPETAVIALGAPLLYWLAYGLIWLDYDERRLVMRTLHLLPS